MEFRVGRSLALLFNGREACRKLLKPWLVEGLREIGLEARFLFVPTSAACEGPGLRKFWAIEPNKNAIPMRQSLAFRENRDNTAVPVASRMPRKLITITTYSGFSRGGALPFHTASRQRPWFEVVGCGC